MKEENKKWHSSVLQMHTALMFEQLIHKHHIVTETAKSYQFEDEDGRELPHLLKGYFAIKEIGGQKKKFFIDVKHYDSLPIKVNDCDEIFFKDSARSKSSIFIPTDITPFRISPGKCFDSEREMINSLAPFEHTEPDQWTLNKITAIMAYVGRTFLGVCSLSEFGKSSIYSILNSLTQKCPLFKPRSVPGVLAQITGDGNMVFDEVHDAPSEVKSCMEDFSLHVGGNQPIYINGAMKSKNTKPRYDVSQQSISYLYNVYSNYKDPEKKFWNFIWANKKAMESRFLCLKFEGKLTEEFDKDFDIPKIAEDNRMLYINLAKHLLYLKQLKLSNGYSRRYEVKTSVALGNRHKIIYDEITWGLDLYCQSQQEMNHFVELLDKSILGYKNMIFGGGDVEPLIPPKQEIKEEFIDSSDPTPKERIMEIVNRAAPKAINIELLKEQAQVDDIDKLVDELQKEGELFRSSLAEVKKL